MAGLQCKKYLWLEVHARRRREPLSEELRRRFAWGHQVGEAARHWRGDGVLIGLDPRRPEQAAEDTREALNAGATRIFEAAFLTKGCFAAADIIEEIPGGRWRMLEVKASGGVRAPYITDLSFQARVVKGAGLVVKEAGVVHLSDGSEPGAPITFSLSDVTGKVLSPSAWIDSEIWRLQGVMAGPEPYVDRGDHCSRPYRCPYSSYCHALNG